MIAIDLSKQEVLDADPRSIQIIHFNGNLDPAGSATIFFTIEKAKRTILNFSEGTVGVLWICSTICFALI